MRGQSRASSLKPYGRGFVRLYLVLLLFSTQDFKQRVKAYEAVYETIEDNEDGDCIQYIKLYNVGQKVVTRNCKGYLPSQVAFYLQASPRFHRPTDNALCLLLNRSHPRFGKWLAFLWLVPPTLSAFL